MVISRNNTFKSLLLFLLLFSVGAGCVYYNTFFNTRKAFNDAEKARKESPYGNPRINSAQYKTAIEKSLKIIENYPNSKWYDDALYVLAVSYYYTKQYVKSERRCREILANYADSKYAVEAQLYMAKSKLQQNEITAAMDIFDELFHGDVPRRFKAEAALALGTFHFENRRYSEATPYFLALRDSLGTDQEKKIAQNYIADGHFQMFQFKKALGAYLQILGMNPDNNERYHALYQAAISCYRLQKIDDGLDYLQTLIKDEVFFDSLGVLKLKVAEGYEEEDDIEEAKSIYEEVATQEKNNKVAAEAYYNLGLTYQFDFDSLTKAKEYYDKVVGLDRGSVIGRDALQRSSDIGKLETYARTIQIDSTTTQQMIDDAAYTQYQLAELYWFKLNKPDTAILEMQYLIDSFPTAYETPNAMVALSQMVKDYEGDTLKADSILRAALEKYSHSDYAPLVLEQLGLLSTAADTGYAGAYIKRAEHFVVDEKNIDSARTYYQYVVDHFPDSKYYLQARFALLWLTETYESPGDSSVILAYNEFVDSFPGTFWGAEALKRTQYRSQQQAPGGEKVDTAWQQEEGAVDTLAFQSDTEMGEDTSSYVDPLKDIYTAPDGGEAYDLPANVTPYVIREEFIYPTEAYSLAWEGDLVFQILLDFTGEVQDFVLKTHSGSEELDRRAIETVVSMTFDVGLLLPELQGSWLVYKFRVRLPEELR